MAGYLHLTSIDLNKRVAIFWFRRDLRLEDNTGLFAALKSGYPVLAVFIFDTEILDGLPEDDARVSFIYNKLRDLSETFRETFGSSIAVYHGRPSEVFEGLLKDFDVRAVYANHDYEPYARERDTAIAGFLKTQGIGFHTFKDQVIFEKDELLKDDGDPYVVYTPYMRKWKAALDAGGLPEIHQTSSYPGRFLQQQFATPGLSELGFKPSPVQVPDYELHAGLIRNYEDKRNFPAMNGTTRLGPHLRFGTVSVRQVLLKVLKEKNETLLNELIWREFFMQILWHFPNTVNESFKKKYDRIQWRNDLAEFEKWKHGKTGFALVDAGIRQLNETGYMHNRVRMLVASFLCKHLLIDWRWGEAYFAGKLLDYELSSNVGNWQWAAGSGVDAAPYFRIFNPITQANKFDPGLEYIKQWVPEFGTDGYVDEMVDHKMARERCLKTYKAALD